MHSKPSAIFRNDKTQYPLVRTGPSVHDHPLSFRPTQVKNHPHFVQKLHWQIHFLPQKSPGKYILVCLCRARSDKNAHFNYSLNICFAKSCPFSARFLRFAIPDPTSLCPTPGRSSRRNRSVLPLTCWSGKSPSRAATTPRSAPKSSAPLPPDQPSPFFPDPLFSVG